MQIALQPAIAGQHQRLGQSRRSRQLHTIRAAAQAALQHQTLIGLLQLRAQGGDARLATAMHGTVQHAAAAGTGQVEAQVPDVQNVGQQRQPFHQLPWRRQAEGRFAGRNGAVCRLPVQRQALAA
ncbi:hypothetical protein D3C78_1090540 [compost metagenome]